MSHTRLRTGPTVVAIAALVLLIVSGAAVAGVGELQSATQEGTAIDSIDHHEAVTPGAEFTVDVTVRNDLAQRSSIDLSANASIGSCSVSQSTVTVARGHPETVAISCSTPDDAGQTNSTISVTADDARASSTVLVDEVGGAIEWTAATGGHGDSSPTVVNETVYVGSRTDDRLYALDRDAGTVRWSFQTGSTIESTPTVANGTVYAGSMDGTLYAVDATTGDPLWTVATDDSIESSPTAASGAVYVGSNDGRVYAFDASTGEERWTVSTDVLVRSSPTVVNGTVYVGSGDVHTGSSEEQLYALDAATGEERWSLDLSQMEGSPTVSNGTVYVGTDRSTLYALDAATGEERWTFSGAARIRSTPTVANGTVYVGTEGGAFGGGAELYAIDADTGTERWSVESASFSSSPTVADGTLFVGAGTGLSAYDATTGAKLWDVPLSDIYVYSSPTVANGTVYVGSYTDGFYAIDAGVSGSSDGSRVRQGTLGHVGDRTLSPGGTAFEIESVRSPSEVQPGTAFEMEATVVNEAAERLTETVELDGGDATCTPDAQSVTLSQGASATTAATCTAPDGASGETLSITVSTAADERTVTVPVAEEDDPATFDVVDAELSQVPDGLYLPVIEPGDDYLLSATIRNEGDEPGTRSVAHVTEAPCENFAAADRYGEVQVELAPGEERQLFFKCDVPLDADLGEEDAVAIQPRVAIETEPGSWTTTDVHQFVDAVEAEEFRLSEPHTQPAFEIRAAFTHESPTVGEETVVEVHMHNDGSPDRQTVTLESDGDEISNRTVQLDRFENTIVALPYEPTQEEIGERNLTVRTDDDSEAFTAEVDPAS